MRLRTQLSALAVAALVVAPVAAEEMVYPLAAAVTPDGTVYVADLRLPGVWKVGDGKAEVYFRGQKTFRTPLNAVRCLAVAKDGRLLAGDSATRDVYVFDEAGKPQPLTGGKIGIPVAIAVNAAGDLFVSDLESARIWTVPAAGGEPKEFAVIAGCRGLAFDGAGRLWAAANTGEPVRRFAADGASETVVAEGPFQFPHQVAVLGETAYVTDNYAKAVWKIEAGKEPTPLAQGAPFVSPVGLAVRGGDLLVADPHAKRVFVVTLEGKVTPLVGGTE